MPIEGWIFIGFVFVCMALYIYASKSYISKLENDLKQAQYNIDSAKNKYERELKRDKQSLQEEYELKHKQLFVALENRKRLIIDEVFSSNLTAIPYCAGIIADFEVVEYDRLIKALDWGNNVERAKKVRSLIEVRKEAREKIAQSKEALYQLAYLKELYPALEDVLEVEYATLPSTQEIPDYDPARNYLSKEEWQSLSTTERNQRALDNYVNSHNKTNWQIGRDYELSVGYWYSTNGFTVDYHGSYMGLEDLGRDLIVTKGKKTSIIQCKYWSQQKVIHEKHIMQLYGTVIAYQLEHPDLPKSSIKGILVTNTVLSDTAKKFASVLKIEYVENRPMQPFPRIKCNIGKDEIGLPEKIYHLPMDQQYDSVKIDKPGEFFALTVEEAEAQGFRRAYRWHSS